MKDQKSFFFKILAYFLKILIGFIEIFRDQRIVNKWWDKNIYWGPLSLMSELVKTRKNSISEGNYYIDIADFTTYHIFYQALDFKAKKFI